MKNSKTLKVIFIRSRGTDPAVNKMAETLSNNGYEVRLLVWDRQHTLSENHVSKYVLDKFMFKAPYDEYITLLYFPIWWIYELFFLLRNKCDIIHACDLDTLIPAILVKIFKRTKLCYTIYDFYANNLPVGTFDFIRRIVRRLVASIEKYGIRYTDCLFLVDESRIEEVEGARIKRLAYLFNSPPDCYVGQTQNWQINKSEVTIFYAGPAIKMRGLQYMVEAVNELDGFNLILAGNIQVKDFLQTSVESAKKIRCLGWLPSYDNVINNTLEADILFRFSDPKIPKTKYESPNKLFESMMCSKPIIVTDGSAMAEIVRKENCGLVVPYGDICALKNALLELRNHELRSLLGENGRKAYENKYSWKIMEQRLINIYRQWGCNV